MRESIIETQVLAWGCPLHCKNVFDGSEALAEHLPYCQNLELMTKKQIAECFNRLLKAHSKEQVKPKSKGAMMFAKRNKLLF